MRPSTIILALTWILLAAAVGLNEAPGQAVDPRIKSVLRDWGDRHKSLRNVKYDFVGTRLIPKGIIGHDENGKPLAVPIPREDLSLPLKRTFLLDLVNNRFRLTIDDQGYDGKRVFTARRTDLFDGKRYKIHNPTAEYPDVAFPGVVPNIVVTTGDAARRQFDFPHWPLFDGIGIAQNYKFRSSAERLVTGPDAELFYTHGVGVHQDRQCTILRTFGTGGGNTGSYEEYWADPSRGNVIVKHLFVRGKIPLYEWRIDYRRYHQGWYPTGWTYLWRNEKLAVRESETVRVSAFSIDETLTTAAFDIEQQPGEVVAVTRFGEPRFGEGGGEAQYPITSQRLDVLTAEGELREIDEVTGQQVVRPWRWWLFGLIPIVAAIGLAWFIIRRRRCLRIVSR